jgi:signal transduction histidine kinase
VLRLSKRLPWIEFALALCVLIAIGVTSDAVTSRLARDQYWVEHTYQVENAIQGLRGNIALAAEARQLYVLAGDTSALAVCRRALTTIPAEVTELRSLTADNSSQSANLAELSGVVDQRMAILGQSTEFHRQNPNDAAQQLQWTQTGTAVENQAVAILDRMSLEEERLMGVRQIISATTYRRVRIVLLVSFAIVVLLISVNFYDLSNELAERRHAERAVLDLSARILHVQDDERRRVARELHDSIGQVFAALKMNLEMAEQSAERGELAQCRELLLESHSVLELGLSGARTLSHLLHPPLLDEVGFTAAARWLVEGFSQRSNIQVKLDIPESLPRMSTDVELTLFRILQEGLTNVHKHSDSRFVEIKVKAEKEQASMSLRDFGKGMPDEVIDGFRTSNPGLGVGLAGMRERVRSLGGTLELRSEGGAVVEATIPLETAATDTAPNEPLRTSPRPVD